MNPVLVEAVDVTKHFALTQSLTDSLTRQEKRVIHAVDGVSLTIDRGESLGLIGESGSGKTTLLNLIAGIVRTSRSAGTRSRAPLNHRANTSDRWRFTEWTDNIGGSSLQHPNIPLELPQHFHQILVHVEPLVQ